MKTKNVVLLAVVLVPVAASADLFVTNFESAGGSIATGVWKNDTTETDLAISVSLTHSNSVFDNDTTLDGTQEWPDFLGNLFEPNYTEDVVSLEVTGLQSSTVVIDFGAAVVDPVLHFSDVDVQTTLIFATANPTKVAGWDNMSVSGASVTTDGTNSHPFDPSDLETLGSLQFTGCFTELQFQIVNTGPSAGDEDRTGFSVATATEPVAMADLPKLSIWTVGGFLHLSWPSTSSFSSIQYTNDLEGGSYSLLPGASPTTQTTWSAPLSNFGDDIYITATYNM